MIIIVANDVRKRPPLPGMFEEDEVRGHESSEQPKELVRQPQTMQPSSSGEPTEQVPKLPEQPLKPVGKPEEHPEEYQPQEPLRPNEKPPGARFLEPIYESKIPTDVAAVRVKKDMAEERDPGQTGSLSELLKTPMNTLTGSEVSVSQRIRDKLRRYMRDFGKMDQASQDDLIAKIALNVAKRAREGFDRLLERTLRGRAGRQEERVDRAVRKARDLYSLYGKYIEDDENIPPDIRNGPGSKAEKILAALKRDRIDYGETARSRGRRQRIVQWWDETARLVMGPSYDADRDSITTDDPEKNKANFERLNKLFEDVIEKNPDKASALGLINEDGMPTFNLWGDNYPWEFDDKGRVVRLIDKWNEKYAEVRKVAMKEHGEDIGGKYASGLKYPLPESKMGQGVDHYNAKAWTIMVSALKAYAARHPEERAAIMEMVRPGGKYYLSRMALLPRSANATLDAAQRAMTTRGGMISIDMRGDEDEGAGISVSTKEEGSKAGEGEYERPAELGEAANYKSLTSNPPNPLQSLRRPREEQVSGLSGQEEEALGERLKIIEPKPKNKKWNKAMSLLVDMTYPAGLEDEVTNLKRDFARTISSLPLLPAKQKSNAMSRQVSMNWLRKHQDDIYRMGTDELSLPEPVAPLTPSTTPSEQDMNPIVRRWAIDSMLDEKLMRSEDQIALRDDLKDEVNKRTRIMQRAVNDMISEGRMRSAVDVMSNPMLQEEMGSRIEELMAKGEEATRPPEAPSKKEERRINLRPTGMSARQKAARFVDVVMSDLMRTLVNDEAYARLEKLTKGATGMRRMLRVARLSIMAGLMRMAA